MKADGGALKALNGAGQAMPFDRPPPRPRPRTLIDNAAKTPSLFAPGTEGAEPRPAGDLDGFRRLQGRRRQDGHGRQGRAGRIAHPISVARAVMEKTPHVMLVGEGATAIRRRAGLQARGIADAGIQQGLARLAEDGELQAEANIEVKSYGQGTNLGTPGGADNHDTIGMLAIDAHGNLSGACTTSGMAWKMRGRVGDSPIIGAGLYVDNEVGGATSTGVGEEVIRKRRQLLVVELMRQGMSPQAACKAAVTRMIAVCTSWAEQSLRATSRTVCRDVPCLTNEESSAGP